MPAASVFSEKFNLISLNFFSKLSYFKIVCPIFEISFKIAGQMANNCQETYLIVYSKTTPRCNRTRIWILWKFSKK